MTHRGSHPGLLALGPLLSQTPSPNTESHGEKNEWWWWLAWGASGQGSFQTTMLLAHICAGKVQLQPSPLGLTLWRETRQAAYFLSEPSFLMCKMRLILPSLVTSED